MITRLKQLEPLKRNASQNLAQNPLKNILEQINAIIPNPININQSYINDIILNIPSSSIIDKYIQQQSQMKLEDFIISHISNIQIFNTIFNIIKYDIPSQYHLEAKQIIDTINYDQFRLFLSNYMPFIKDIHETYELICSMSNTSIRKNKLLKSLAELLKQNDTIGTEYDIGPDFYMDILVSRDRPWIIIDGEIKRGRHITEHGAMANEYSDQLYVEEHDYDDNQSRTLEKPFIFGYAKENVAVIEGILEKDIPAPDLTSIVQILSKEYGKVYNQVKSNNLLTRLAKRIRLNK